MASHLSNVAALAHTLDRSARKCRGERVAAGRSRRPRRSRAGIGDGASAVLGSDGGDSRRSARARKKSLPFGDELGLAQSEEPSLSTKG